MNKRVLLSIFIVLTGLNALTAADNQVVPAMKAPYSINSAEWSKSGDYFAYEVNGTVYIRDSLTLLLKDSFAKNSKSDISAFYANPSQVDYPRTSIQPNGTGVIISTQKNAGSSVETAAVNNLPVKVKAAAINKNQTHLAFIGSDGNAYIYDTQAEKVTAQFPCNGKSGKVFITKNNSVIISDSEKTVGIYDLSGNKKRSCVNSTSISGISLSSDDETLMVYGNNGVVNFYNTASANQIGYIPNLGSKNIQDAVLSKDSKRILITTDNSMFISPVQDVLFSPNTVAPSFRQFAFNYNALDPNDRSNAGVTEYGIHEVQVEADQTDAEYILSTREKELGKQTFDLDEEKKASPDVILSNQPEQAYFPPSLIEAEKDVLFTDRNNVAENQVKVQEFKQPQDYLLPTSPVPNADKVQIAPKVTQITPPVPSTGSGFGTGGSGSGSGAGGSGGSGYGYGTGGNGGGGGNGSGDNVVINIYGNGDQLLPEPELPGTEETAAEENDKKEKKNRKEEKEKDKKNKLTEEDMKTYFKDGHGLLFNIDFYKMNHTYYSLEVSFQTGYRNYNLIRPFYFGGTIEPFIGMPDKTFPRKYVTSNQVVLNNPYLIGVNLYSPIGFCMYPMKNSFEVYAEIGLGMTLTSMWNGKSLDYALVTNPYPAFFTSIQIGVMWDFLNLSLSGNYDAIKGFSYGITAGAIINIYGSRKIGSLIFK